MLDGLYHPGSEEIVFQRLMNTLDLEQIYRLFFLLRLGWEPALGACPAQEDKNLAKRKRLGFSRNRN